MGAGPGGSFVSGADVGRELQKAGEASFGLDKTFFLYIGQTPPLMGKGEYAGCGLGGRTGTELAQSETGIPNKKEVIQNDEVSSQQERAGDE